MSDILKCIQEQREIMAKEHTERVFSFIQESNITFLENIEKNPAILGRIEADLMELNTKSQNGTYYDDNWYKLAIEENKSFQERLPKKLVLGELDHPDKPGTSGAKSAFSLIKVWREGNIVRGILEVFNTSSGKDFWTLLKAEVCLGFSLRGIGSDYYENGVMKIEGKNFDLKGWDAVVDPSFVIAKFKGFVEEKKTHLVNTLTSTSLPASKLILENVNVLLKEERKTRLEEFENKQLRVLVEKQKNIVEDYRKAIIEKDNKIKENTNENKLLSNSNKDLRVQLEQKNKILESKEKTNISLSNKIKQLNLESRH